MKNPQKSFLKRQKQQTHILTYKSHKKQFKHKIWAYKGQLQMIEVLELV